jgi:glycerophosphoryl diester phosphodiesterase
MAVEYFAGKRPRLFAHRGASGLLPENTMAAFRAGVEAGATHLELDVHGSRDGAVVVIHDETLERTTDSVGAVREMTLAELRSADAGYGFRDESGKRPFAERELRIPTFEEVLREFPDVPLNVEIKQGEPGIEEEAIALIRRYGGSSRVLLAAEHQPIMDRLRARYDGPTGFTADEALDFYLCSIEGRWVGYRPPGQALQVPPRYGEVDVVTPRLIAAARHVGIEVHVWTINDADLARDLLAMGVDGIMSDLPGMAARVIADA